MNLNFAHIIEHYNNKSIKEYDFSAISKDINKICEVVKSNANDGDLLLIDLGDIGKIPFPYLGDMVTKKRMEKNKTWYPYMTAKSVIQSLGRSIRNDKDHAVSYILDGDWERFYRMNRKMFPPEFDAAMK
jgi:hypothetical protein